MKPRWSEATDAERTEMLTKRKEYIENQIKAHLDMIITSFPPIDPPKYTEIRDTHQNLFKLFTATDIENNKDIFTRNEYGDKFFSELAFGLDPSTNDSGNPMYIQFMNNYTPSDVDSERRSRIEKFFNGTDGPMNFDEIVTFVRQDLIHRCATADRSGNHSTRILEALMEQDTGADAAQYKCNIRMLLLFLKENEKITQQQYDRIYLQLFNQISSEGHYMGAFLKIDRMSRELATTITENNRVAIEGIRQTAAASGLTGAVQDGASALVEGVGSTIMNQVKKIGRGLEVELIRNYEYILSPHIRKTVRDARTNIGAGSMSGDPYAGLQTDIGSIHTDMFTTILLDQQRREIAAQQPSLISSIGQSIGETWTNWRTPGSSGFTVSGQTSETTDTPGDTMDSNTYSDADLEAAKRDAIAACDNFTDDKYCTIYDTGFDNISQNCECCILSKEDSANPILSNEDGEIPYMDCLGEINIIDTTAFTYVKNYIQSMLLSITTFQEEIYNVYGNIDDSTEDFYIDYNIFLNLLSNNNDIRLRDEGDLNLILNICYNTIDAYNYNDLEQFKESTTGLQLNMPTIETTVTNDDGTVTTYSQINLNQLLFYYIEPIMLMINIITQIDNNESDFLDDELEKLNETNIKTLKNDEFFIQPRIYTHYIDDIINTIRLSDENDIIVHHDEDGEINAILKHPDMYQKLSELKHLCLNFSVELQRRTYLARIYNLYNEFWIKDIGFEYTPPSPPAPQASGDTETPGTFDFMDMTPRGGSELLSNVFELYREALPSAAVPSASPSSPPPPPPPPSPEQLAAVEEAKLEAISKICELEYKYQKKINYEDSFSSEINGICGVVKHQCDIDENCSDILEQEVQNFNNYMENGPFFLISENSRNMATEGGRLVKHQIIMNNDAGGQDDTSMTRTIDAAEYTRLSTEPGNENWPPIEQTREYLFHQTMRDIQGRRGLTEEIREFIIGSMMLPYSISCQSNELCSSFEKCINTAPRNDSQSELQDGTITGTCNPYDRQTGYLTVIGDSDCDDMWLAEGDTAAAAAVRSSPGTWGVAARRERAGSPSARYWEGRVCSPDYPVILLEGINTLFDSSLGGAPEIDKFAEHLDYWDKSNLDNLWGFYPWINNKITGINQISALLNGTAYEGESKIFYDSPIPPYAVYKNKCFIHSDNPVIRNIASNYQYLNSKQDDCNDENRDSRIGESNCTKFNRRYPADDDVYVEYISDTIDGWDTVASAEECASKCSNLPSIDERQEESRGFGHLGAKYAPGGCYAFEYNNVSGECILKGIPNKKETRHNFPADIDNGAIDDNYAWEPRGAGTTASDGGSLSDLYDYQDINLYDPDDPIYNPLKIGEDGEDLLRDCQNRDTYINNMLNFYAKNSNTCVDRVDEWQGGHIIGTLDTDIIQTAKDADETHPVDANGRLIGDRDVDPVPRSATSQKNASSINDLGFNSVLVEDSTNNWSAHRSLGSTSAYGTDPNSVTVRKCVERCEESPDCEGFQFTIDHEEGTARCEFTNQTTKVHTCTGEDIGSTESLLYNTGTDGDAEKRIDFFTKLHDNTTVNDGCQYKYIPPEPPNINISGFADNPEFYQAGLNGTYAKVEESHYYVKIDEDTGDPTDNMFLFLANVDAPELQNADGDNALFWTIGSNPTNQRGFAYLKRQSGFTMYDTGYDWESIHPIGTLLWKQRRNEEVEAASGWEEVSVTAEVEPYIRDSKSKCISSNNDIPCEWNASNVSDLQNYFMCKEYALELNRIQRSYIDSIPGQVLESDTVHGTVDDLYTFAQDEFPYLTSHATEFGLDAISALSPSLSAAAGAYLNHDNPVIEWSRAGGFGRGGERMAQNFDDLWEKLTDPSNAHFGSVCTDFGQWVGDPYDQRVPLNKISDLPEEPPQACNISASGLRGLPEVSIPDAELPADPESCQNEIRDNLESGTDCGGSFCGPLGYLCPTADCNCVISEARGGIPAQTCDGPHDIACPEDWATNGITNVAGGEATACQVNDDCESGLCSPQGQCHSCTNDMMDGDERGTDCGGTSCDACDVGVRCRNDNDCLDSSCINISRTSGWGECGYREEQCQNEIQDNLESGTDCGGSFCGPLGYLCPTADCNCVISEARGGIPAQTCDGPYDIACPEDWATNGITNVAGGEATACQVNDDCESGLCSPQGQCHSCTNDMMDGDERGTDCGGTSCDACGGGSRCVNDNDCPGSSCINISRTSGWGECAPPPPPPPPPPSAADEQALWDWLVANGNCNDMNNPALSNVPEFIWQQMGCGLSCADMDNPALSDVPQDVWDQMGC